MRQSIILAWLLLFSLAMSASERNRVLQNVYARDTTSLNGTWQTIVDPFDNGYYDYRLKEYDDGFFKNRGPRNNFDHVEYDFCDAETLCVPGDWNTQRPELFFYEGSLWYKKDFQYQPKDDARLYVYFAGSNYKTDVYVNGKKVGVHKGGFTPFNFDITDYVQEGDNFIVARVNATRFGEEVPTINTDWWNYGGITRDVMLVETPSVSIDDYSVKLTKGSYETIDVQVALNQPVAGVDIKFSIPELKINKTLTTDADGVAKATIKVKPALWSPESPKLYDVVLANGGESIADRIGFRHIETKGKQVLLNGKPVFLSGISIHEEAPYRTGRCNNLEDADTLLAWAKELGCNFLRLAHYPHNEKMVRRAEEQGFMIWSEIPVYWTIHWDNPDTYANASSQLCDMINRDHNRCAIVVWSIANETPHSQARDHFLSGLARQVRAKDDERLVSMAMEPTGIDHNTTQVHDTMHEYVDIVSFNNYLGWYGGKPQDCDSRSFDIPYDKPVFISEFGAGAVAGLHGPADQKWTEEYQADLYDRTLKMYDRVDGFSGCSPWILMDFRSPRRQNHQTQNFFNRKGLVSDQGKKKAAFYTLRDFYAKKNKATE